MEGSQDSPVARPPSPAGGTGSGRPSRRVLATVAIAVGGFALGWLYSTFIGCHST